MKNICYFAYLTTFNGACQNIKTSILVQLLLGLLFCWPKETAATTCSSSVPQANAIIRQVDYYTGFTAADTYAIEVGQSSGNLYILEYITSSDQMVVRRVLSDFSNSWIASFLNSPLPKSLKVDSSETNIYVAAKTNPIDILKLDATTGAIITTNQLSSLQGSSQSTRIFLSSSNSGYYIVAMGVSTSKINLCSYAFSTPSTIGCQELSISSMSLWAVINLNGEQFLFITTESSLPNYLWFYKTSYGSTSTTWSSKCTSPSSSSSQDKSDVVLSSDSSLIYAFFSYGDLIYVHFVALNATNGNVVGTRYKSNQSSCQVNSVSLFTSYVVAATLCSSKGKVIVYSLSNSTFIIKDTVFGQTVDTTQKDPTYGRLIIGGK